MPDRRAFLAGTAVVGATPFAASSAQGGPLAVPVLAPRPTRDQPVVRNWWAIQLHAHANWFVPQLPWTTPDEVVRWYRTHGFNAVAVTDLNYFTPPQGLKALFDAPGRFLVISGTEPSREPEGVGVRIVDTLGIGIEREVDLAAANRGDSSLEILNNQARAIRAVGGLPIAAHPNLTWALTAKDVANSDPGSHPRFFEFCNTEPGSNWVGGGGRPGTEELWDQALTLSGRKIFGIAADDSHHFFEFIKSRRPDEPLANPGRAWIMVRAKELAWPTLRKAMEAGDFYATTGQVGITLEDYQVDGNTVRIVLNSDTNDLGWSVGHHNSELFTTTFIGQNGKILKVDTTGQPSYTLKRGDRYVRAKIVGSDGDLAWTQPVFQ